MARPMRRTRIVATLGPASDGRVAELVAAGVDVFRLNFAHGTQAEHAARISAVRAAAGDRPVAILGDLGGPKLRLDRPVVGRTGDIVALSLPPTVRPGDPVLLADGRMLLEVVDAGRARVVVGGEVPAGKGLNLPASCLDLPALTPKDEADLRFAASQGVDLIALSFVARPEDIAGARGAGLPVIAKIERATALDHLEGIVAAADGVLVARGDLGVEIAIERVPLVQKQVIALANRLARPVITATQMLRSMVDSPLPTRAEATDVANAVLDGSDAVMLSEETAIGAWPVEAVRTMARIVREAETVLGSRLVLPSGDVAGEVAHAACVLAERLQARAIVVGTRTGATARLVARHRPPAPVIALTPDESVRRRLSLVWGVTAVTVPWYDSPEAVLRNFREPVLATGLATAGATVVVTAVWPGTAGGHTNLVHAAML